MRCCDRSGPARLLLPCVDTRKRSDAEAVMYDVTPSRDGGVHILCKCSSVKLTPEPTLAVGSDSCELIATDRASLVQPV